MSYTPSPMKSEVVVCIYGSAIERFYDEQGNETEMVVMKAGSEIPGVWIEQGQYHSLEATDEMGGVYLRRMPIGTNLEKLRNIYDKLLLLMFLFEMSYLCSIL